MHNLASKICIWINCISIVWRNDHLYRVYRINHRDVVISRCWSHLIKRASCRMIAIGNFGKFGKFLNNYLSSYYVKCFAISAEGKKKTWKPAKWLRERTLSMHLDSSENRNPLQVLEMLLKNGVPGDERSLCHKRRNKVSRGREMTNA